MPYREVRLLKICFQFCSKEIGILSDALIIPLGKSVEEILKILISENVITEEQCLLGFPHPSGANGHRRKQFALNKRQLQEKIYKFICENI